MPAAKPTEPNDAKEPPDGDPGGMDSISGEAEETELHEPDETKEHWIEIHIVDEADEPLAAEPFAITLPNGRVARGTTDKEGLARIDGIDSGNCDICFTRLDEGAWEEA